MFNFPPFHWNLGVKGAAGSPLSPGGDPWEAGDEAGEQFPHPGGYHGTFVPCWALTVPCGWPWRHLALPGGFGGRSMSPAARGGWGIFIPVFGSCVAVRGTRTP